MSTPEQPARDPGLPVRIKPVPGGFALTFANGGPYVCGREPHVASSSGPLTLDQAEELAQETARALTTAGAPRWVL